MESIAVFLVVMFGSVIRPQSPYSCNANQNERSLKLQWFFYQYAAAFLALSLAGDLLEVFGFSQSFGQSAYWVALAPGIGSFINKRLGSVTASSET